MRLRNSFFLLSLLTFGCNASQDLGSNTDDGGAGAIDGRVGNSGDGAPKSDGAQPTNDAATNPQDGSSDATRDGAATQDGAIGDGASGSDGSASLDGTPGTDGSVAQGACAPGTYRCGVDDSVEICNAGGTSWLYHATCANSCSAGLCLGACTPGAMRCNGSNSEQCNSGGTAWSVVQSCASTFCAPTGACALDGLDVGLNQSLDGVVYVKGAVDVHTNATLTSPAGDLTIYADSITVEVGGAIVVAPTGDSPLGKGANGGNYQTASLGYYIGGGGGGYGTAGASADPALFHPGPVWGSSVDSDVAPGSKGGGNPAPLPQGGAGGGVLRLFASRITMAGQIVANGQNGQGWVASEGKCVSGGAGGSGGGVLLAGDNLTMTGSISAAGGAFGVGSPNDCYSDYDYQAGAGGNGRVKMLWGSTHAITGTVTGTTSQGILPPIPITSTSHPDQTLVYNDGCPNLLLSWAKPFPSSQGYYVILSQNEVAPPTPTTGQFMTADFFSASVSQLGFVNEFHIVPVDETSTVGTIESVFSVVLNKVPPSLASSTNPNQAAWSSNVNPLFQWSLDDSSANGATTAFSGIYYVFDHDGSTVPDESASFIPASQTQQLFTNVAPGVWVFHAVSVDTHGYLTTAASHYRVNIGADPGSGGILGTVVDGSAVAVNGATVTVNNGLYTQTTNSSGSYNFMSIPVGTWQVTASANGKSVSKSVVVAANMSSALNLALP